jgi:hypothetical protein
MPEMEMLVAGSQLKKPVVSFKVDVWIADEDVPVSGVRGHNRKPHEFSKTGCDLTFDRTACGCRDVFVTDHPLRTEDV